MDGCALCGCTWGTAHMWRSKNNFGELVLSFQGGGSGTELRLSGWVEAPVASEPLHQLHSEIQLKHFSIFQIYFMDKF